jgi:hypothetical protein
MRIRTRPHTALLAVILSTVVAGCASSRAAPDSGRPDLVHVVVENHTLETVVVRVGKRGHAAEFLGRILPMSRRTFSMPSAYMTGAELELISAPLSGRLDVPGRSLSTPFMLEGARAVHWAIREGHLLSTVALR